MTITPDKLEKFYDVITPRDLAGGFSLRSSAGRTAFEQLLEILVHTEDDGVYNADETVVKLNDFLNTSDPAASDLIAEFNDKIQVYHDGALVKGAQYTTSNPITQMLKLAGPPSPGVPKLCAFLSNSPRVSPAMRNMNKVILFMNSIPTLEMSRCVPYLDVKFRVGRPPMTDAGQVQTFSLFKFLEGAKTLSPGTVDRALVDGTVITSPFDPSKKGTSVNMEVFTSPQTLVNANLDQSSQSRAGPVLDPFRPLMSIDSFEVEVVPRVGMFTYERADLHITLHDRSRLAEISDLIKPEVFGRTQLDITYGWSHPDGDETSNAYGALINSMRVTKKFGIRNASFLFDTVGQAKITLDLYTVGVNELQGVKIADSEAFKSAQQMLQEITEVVGGLRDELNLATTPNRKEVRVYQILDAIERGELPDLSNGDNKKQLETLISDLRQKKSKTAAQDLAAKLEEIVGNKTKKTDPLKTRLDSSVTNYIDSKFNLLSGKSQDGKTSGTAIDTFLLNAQGGTSKDVKKAARYSQEIESFNKEAANSRLVSLGKLLLVFVGQSLQSVTDVLDEIQFIFYGFNSNAGLAGDRNIAEFPIDLTEFTKLFKSYALQKNNPNLSVEEFVKFLSDVILSDPRAIGYGLRKFYAKRTDQEKYPTPLKQYSEQKISDVMSELTKAAGGTFKMPLIEAYVETLPRRVATSGIDASLGRAQSIMRVHVYDKQSSPHQIAQHLLAADSTLANVLDAIKQNPAASESDKAILSGFSEAATLLSQDQFGIQIVNNEIVGNIDDIKNFAKRLVPSLTYGSNNTNIFSAQLQTMQNQLLSTVNMMRAGKPNPTQPNGTSVGGLPLRVIPTTLDMSSFGCPLLNVNQQFFIDFSTSCSVDNLYLLTGLSHTISPGRFESKWKMVTLDSYGRYESVAAKANILIQKLKKDQPANKG